MGTFPVGRGYLWGLLRLAGVKVLAPSLQGVHSVIVAHACLPSSVILPSPADPRFYCRVAVRDSSYGRELIACGLSLPFLRLPGASQSEMRRPRKGCQTLSRMIKKMVFIFPLLVPDCCLTFCVCGGRERKKRKGGVSQRTCNTNRG